MKRISQRDLSDTLKSPARRERKRRLAVRALEATSQEEIISLQGQLDDLESEKRTYLSSYGSGLNPGPISDPSKQVSFTLDLNTLTKQSHKDLVRFAQDLGVVLPLVTTKAEVISLLTQRNIT